MITAITDVNDLSAVSGGRRSSGFRVSRSGDVVTVTDRDGNALTGQDRTDAIEFANAERSAFIDRINVGRAARGQRLAVFRPIPV